MKKHDKKNGVSALSEDNVSEGFSKNAKYEILAILRENSESNQKYTAMENAGKQP
jgi:hypothetical protein